MKLWQIITVMITTPFGLYLMLWEANRQAYIAEREYRMTLRPCYEGE